MAKLYFKYGTMNSGKTIDIMRTVHNYEELGYSVLIMKPKIDTKGGNFIDSRIGIKKKVDYLIDDKINLIDFIKKSKKENLACIFVDEAQFLKKEIIDQLFFTTKNLDIPVICYGLRSNFKMEGFEGSTRLLQIADEISELKTLCRCGKIARFNARYIGGKFSKEGIEIMIDGMKEVKYIPLCGKCFLEELNK